MLPAENQTGYMALAVAILAPRPVTVEQAFQRVARNRSDATLASGTRLRT